MSWIFGDIDFTDYGVMVSRSAGILDIPKLITEGHDWLDEDGKDYWQDEPKFSDREIILNCWIIAERSGMIPAYDVFKSKLEGFTNALKTAGKVTFQTPYINLTQCSISKGVTVVRETNYVQDVQAGTFTLRITVHGDIDFQQVDIKRWTGTETLTAATVFTRNLKVNKSLQADIYATCSFESNTKLDLKYFDYIEVTSNGSNKDIFHLPTEAIFKKSSTNKYLYDLKFNHQGSWLEDSKFLNDREEADFEYYANMDEIMDMIIVNHDRSWWSNFSKGTVVSTIRKNHKFNDESCLSVLKRLCLEYELEFEFEFVTAGTYKINIKEKVANDKILTMQYGKGNGLYELNRETIDRNELCTILYAFGAAKNLKPTYRSGMSRLSFDNNPLKNNEGLYVGAGPVEKVVYFEDIYPNRTATVEGYTQKLPDDGTMTVAEKEVFPEGIYIVEDSTINFDINDYLLGGLSAKIRLKTGDLAGFEFEIFKYTHLLHQIFIIPFKDERGDFYPNANFMIAAGDEYTLVDIDQPESYVAVAEAELEAAAAAYLADHSIPKFPYRVMVDPAFMLANPGGFEVGDRITVVDTDYGINGLYRISNLSYDVYKKFYELTLSDTALLSKRQKQEMRIRAVERAMQDTGKDEVEQMRKDQETVEELRVRLLDPFDDKFKVDNIVRNQGLDPRMLGLDAGTLQWSLQNALVECNVDDDYDKVTIDAGTLTLHNWAGEDRYTIARMKELGQTYDPTRQWIIPATEFNLTSPNVHWMYAKLDLTGGSTDCEIILNEDHIEGKFQIADNFLYIKKGFISSSASPRYAGMIWGNVRTPSISVINTMISAAKQSIGDIYYLHGNDSDITDYKQALNDLPDDAEGTVAAATDLATGEVLIEEFATESANPGVTVIPAGVWIFESYVKTATADGTNSLKIKVFKRAADDTEVELFNVVGNISSLTPDLLSIATDQPDMALLATDRIVFKYYFSTTFASTQTATLYFEGAVNFSRIRTSIKNPNLGGGENTDEKVKYDSEDPTAGYLADKIIAGTGISLAEGTGANENKLVVTNTAIPSTPFSGDYNDLTNKPTIPAAAAQPFQALIKKDIEAGTSGSEYLVIDCLEGLTIDSVTVFCDDGTLTGCYIQINGTFL